MTFFPNDEEHTILKAWFALEALCAAQADITEPVEMLDHVTDIIMSCYEVRRAIGDSWNAANFRAFPNPSPRLVHRRPQIPTALDYTEEEILAALATLREPQP